MALVTNTYIGNYKEDATIHFLWGTNAANGASVTRTVNGEVRVYKDNNVAQSTAGITDTEDFDGLTGIHACTIDLSSDAFYAVGADYTVVLQGATIDGQTVNAVLAHFSIENQYPSINEIADQVWDEILTGATHNIATSAGRRLREIAGFAVHSGTAQAGTTTTITLAADADGGDGIYNRNLIVIIGGTGAGQTRTITDYDNTTKVCAVDREWHINPNDTSEYQILADDTPLTVDHGIAREGTLTTITLRASASSVNDIYLCNIIAILGGTGRGQARLVGSYNGTTKVVTICGDDWVTTPDDTSIYAMIPYGTTCASCVGTYALAQVVDGAWDELQSGHTDAGSFGKYLDTEVTGVGGIGSGALSCTWTQKDDGDNPMDNVQIWITTDEAGVNVIAGTLLTDASGEVTFMLDAGTYYVWRERAGFNFQNPQTWTVS